MKVFSCPVCQGPVYFENVSCLQCGAALAYDISTDAFRSGVVLCAESQSVESCNWMVMGDGPFCRSCFIDTDHMATERRWPFQRSKRRALRQLARFHVDLDWSPLLRFDLRDGSVEGPITIGHQDGVITLDTAEADPPAVSRCAPASASRIAARSAMCATSSATGTGRHTSATASRPKRSGPCSATSRCRTPRRIERHYASLDDGSWLVQYISYYASMHPWEDFAESFAHLLHITDTLETAAAYGLGSVGAVAVALGVGDFQRFYQQWIDVSVALNELNRSMGAPDAYPFAPSSRGDRQARVRVGQLSAGAPARA